MTTLIRKGIVSVDSMIFEISATEGSTEGDVFQGCVAFGRSLGSERIKSREELQDGFIIGLGPYGGPPSIKFELLPVVAA